VWNSDTGGEGSSTTVFGPSLSRGRDGKGMTRKEELELGHSNCHKK